MDQFRIGLKHKHFVKCIDATERVRDSPGCKAAKLKYVYINADDDGNNDTFLL